MISDPRSSGTYTRTRRQWLDQLPLIVICCLCGDDLDTSLSGNDPDGPTVEHRIPVRVIINSGADWSQIVRMTCDTGAWAPAHRRCQNAQGADVVNAVQQPSRVW